MGSTGDRAASLMIGGAEHARGDGRLRAHRAACLRPLIRAINETFAETGVEAATPASVRAGSSINLPTYAYDASLRRMWTKQWLLERIRVYRALIKPFHLCSLGDGKG
jgi:hypothetical protein